MQQIIIDIYIIKIENKYFLFNLHTGKNMLVRKIFIEKILLKRSFSDFLSELFLF